MNNEQDSKTSFPYLPHTGEDRAQMLKSIGVESFEDLVSHVPKEIRVKELNIPAGLNELELTDYVRKLADKNVPASRQVSFLGAGWLRRYVPASVAAIVSRSEFATAYTPYQPEVAQGTLQVIYEFQTAICLLTDMDVANASIYDGPTACAEAALMAGRVTERNKVVMAESCNPEYAAVTKTYLETCGLSCQIIQTPDGVVDVPKLNLTPDIAGVVVQYPNFFGCLEELGELAEAAHKNGSLLIVVADPINLALLEPPGKFGADIVVGDAQQCGNNLSYGGPSAGFMATRDQYIRQLPGRLCGLTVDNRGQRAFTLTLQTREQHIRRARATSNICTNQALNALTMLVYLTLVGPKGLHQLAETGLQRAHVLADLFQSIPGVRLKFNRPFVNEFVIETDRCAAEVLDALKANGILGGFSPYRTHDNLKNAFIVSVTEVNSPSELQHYADVLRRIVTELSRSESQPVGCR